MNRLPHSPDRSDLLGQRFGKLLVTDRSSRFLICQCDCGGERSVLAYELRRGKATTCGLCDNGVRMVPGARFGLWTIISDPIRIGRRFAFLCRCDCGTEKQVLKSNLTVGESKSCGCDARKKSSERGKHHACEMPEYRIWVGMRSRCSDISHVSYHNYGGRGIRVCAEWSDFERFINDVGCRPSLSHEIDRINNDGNYEPGNVKWSTHREQCNNTRRNHWVEYDSEIHTLAQWAEIMKIDQRRIYEHIIALGGKTTKYP